jgi:hypothetical protein
VNSTHGLAVVDFERKVCWIGLSGSPPSTDTAWNGLPSSISTISRIRNRFYSVVEHGFFTRRHVAGYTFQQRVRLVLELGIQDAAQTDFRLRLPTGRPSGLPDLPLGNGLPTGIPSLRFLAADTPLFTQSLCAGTTHRSSATPGSLTAEVGILHSPIRTERTSNEKWSA